MAFTLLYNDITITKKGTTTYQWLVQKVSIIEISLLGLYVIIIFLENVVADDLEPVTCVSFTI